MSVNKTENPKSVGRMVDSLIKIHDCYKEELALQGLGVVIVEREWKLDYNPFNGLHRTKRLTYKSVKQLERFKNVPIDVIGIDGYDPTGKNLLDLVNEYGTTRVISAEMAYDPFWFQEPKTPNWRFWRVLVKPWDTPARDELVSIFKILSDL